MRNYGRFTTSIWRDPDFTSLTLEEQAVYFTLGLQPDVSAAGTLPLTTRRWAKLSSGTSREQIEKLIASLGEHAGQHIVTDDDSEELLIRKFIKWDGGWSNSKRMPVVIEAIRAVASVHIRDIAVDELRKLVASPATSDEQKRSREALSDALSGFDRVVVTQVGYEPQPLTATPEPGTGIPKGEPVVDDPRSEFCPKHQPNGAPGGCRDCATRRTARQEQKRAALEAEVAARKAAREAIDACEHCDEKGVREHPRSRQPLGRCDHKPLEVEVAS